MLYCKFEDIRAKISYFAKKMVLENPRRLDEGPWTR